MEFQIEFQKNPAQNSQTPRDSIFVSFLIEESSDPSTNLIDQYISFLASENFYVLQQSNLLQPLLFNINKINELNTMLEKPIKAYFYNGS